METPSIRRSKLQQALHFWASLFSQISHHIPYFHKFDLMHHNCTYTVYLYAGLQALMMHQCLNGLESKSHLSNSPNVPYTIVEFLVVVAVIAAVVVVVFVVVIVVVVRVIPRRVTRHPVDAHFLKKFKGNLLNLL